MTFYTLLGASIALSALVAAGVSAMFHKSVQRIYAIISNDTVGRACSVYVLFASLVVGVGSGVRTYHLNRYLNKQSALDEILTLSPEAWVLELWGAVDSVLGNLAWVYLWVFHLALAAYIVLRLFGRIRNDAQP